MADTAPESQQAAGEPTLMQLKADAQAAKRADRKQKASETAKAAAPSTSTKRRTLKLSKSAERYVADMVEGKRTGQYGGTDVEMGDIAGFEVKNLPEFPALLVKILEQAHKGNAGTGRLDMGALVNKVGAGGRREGIYIGWLSDLATFRERVQDDGD